MAALVTLQLGGTARQMRGPERVLVQFTWFRRALLSAIPSVHVAYLLPALALSACLLVYPLAQLTLTSFQNKEGMWTLANYWTIARSDLFARVLGTTVQISIGTTIISVVLAYPVAWHLSRLTPRVRTIVLLLVLLPFWTSTIVKSFAFTVLLGSNGLIQHALMKIGLIDAPLRLLNNRIGVYIGMVHYFIPVVVFPILANLLTQDPNLRKASAVLGAGPVRTFLRVTLPQSYPGVASGAILVFVLSLGFFLIPALLGGRHDIMLANLIDFYTRESLDWGMASAIAIFLLFFAGIVVVVASRLPGGEALLRGEDSGSVK
jgi:putative spermidine/putrescine transport system permease protein